METSSTQINRISTNRPLTIDPLKWLSVLSAFGFFFGLYLALIYAPSDSLQGEVQRIFYLHLASFTGAFVGFISTVLGGMAYLRTRNVRWDRLAHAGVEVGLLLAAINVMTGAIYARPIVNAWWTWDPKLTAVSIMALTYASYLMLRNGVESPDRRRLFASVYGISAFVTVVYTFAIIRTRSDVLHEVMFEPGAGLLGMPAPMQTALFANILIWAGLITPVLMAWRIRLEHLLQENERLRLDILGG
ncbi:cytochrome c biogenesis protein CcsA [bacterium]|nr:cytochrome c biogenesis protein CcsA [bacterium]